MFTAAGIDREWPGKNPADPVVQPTSVLPWRTTCSSFFVCFGVFWCCGSPTPQGNLFLSCLQEARATGKSACCSVQALFFSASGGNRVWIHTKGKAIFIKEVPTLPLQTNHSWLGLQLQPYRKEEGGLKKHRAYYFLLKSLASEKAASREERVKHLGQTVKFSVTNLLFL